MFLSKTSFIKKILSIVMFLLGICLVYGTRYSFLGGLLIGFGFFTFGFKFNFEKKYLENQNNKEEKCDG